jgi:hypothetical protein
MSKYLIPIPLRLDLCFHFSDPLTLVKCEPFIGEPGSTTPGSQPFKLEVDSNVLLAMDFHAHLMTTEIIGFLAGEWDKEAMCKGYMNDICI